MSMTKAPLQLIYTVDGSSLTIEDTKTKPYRKWAFVKTALLRLHLTDIDRARRHRPIHPIVSTQLLKNFCTYCTVFPLRNVHFANNLITTMPYAK
jgi:hypothetical protein